MASERALDVMVRRHVFETDRPIASVLDGIFSGISQPGIAELFSKLAASSTFQEFSSLVDQAQGSAGLMVFLRLDLDQALTLDPQAPDWTGRRLVRLIAGNPVTMGQMTRHVPDAGSYAPVTILVEETPEGGTRVAYDSVASEIARYRNAAASAVARQLDAEVTGLLRQATGAQAPAALCSQPSDTRAAGPADDLPGLGARVPLPAPRGVRRRPSGVLGLTAGTTVRSE
jgi:uncharacterized protein (DUF302 family)